MALVRKELIRPERTTLAGEDAFRFRHLLIRDAAYEAIPKAQRPSCTSASPTGSSGGRGDAVVEQEEILGYHLEQAHAYRTQLGPADDRSDAIGLRAAAHARRGRSTGGRAGRSVAASNLLRRAASSEPDAGPSGPGRSTTWVDALLWAGDAQSAFAAFDEAAGVGARMPAIGPWRRLARISAP